MILGCVSGSRRRLARGCIGAGLALAATLAALPQAAAQGYPSRPGKSIVPFPAGGTAAAARRAALTAAAGEDFRAVPRRRPRRRDAARDRRMASAEMGAAGR